MTTRELIERVDLWWKGGFMTVKADDYDALCAAVLAVLDEEIGKCRMCFGKGWYTALIGFSEYAKTDCPDCSNARALRERVKG